MSGYQKLDSTQSLNRIYYPWLIWGLVAMTFFIEYFARVAPGVMIDPLMRDFKVEALALGSLSAFFYYAYVGMQIPVGILVDRFNLRWLLTSMILVCAMGCFIFSVTSQLAIAAFARLMMGFGAAFAFVSALKVASVWFPARRFGLLAGLTQAVGMLGAALGQMPMAYLVAHLGWRATLFLIATVMVLLACLIATVVRDRASASLPSFKKDRLHSPYSGLREVVKNPQSWLNALFAGLLYAPTAAMAELWGVKFFRQSYHLSNEVAAMAVGLIFIGWAIGGPMVGWISDRIKRRKIVLILSAFLSLLFASIFLMIQLPLMVLFSLLFLYGLANTGVATAYAVASEINSLAVSGTSVAFANMASVLIGAGFQPLIGWLLEKNWDGVIKEGIPVYSASDFHLALIVLLCSLLLALLVACCVRETYCQRK